MDSMKIVVLKDFGENLIAFSSWQLVQLGMINDKKCWKI